MDRPSLLRRAVSAMLSLRLARLAPADAASANRVQRRARKSRYLHAHHACQQNPSRARRNRARDRVDGRAASLGRAARMRWSVRRTLARTRRGGTSRAAIAHAFVRARAILARRPRATRARADGRRMGGAPCRAAPQPRCASGTTGRCSTPV
jgi:hypothetical protein